jgi:hypothetical protein
VIARRPEALVAELPGLLANAASARADRRDGANLAGRGTRHAMGGAVFDPMMRGRALTGADARGQMDALQELGVHWV